MLASTREAHAVFEWRSSLPEVKVGVNKKVSLY